MTRAGVSPGDDRPAQLSNRRSRIAAGLRRVRALLRYRALDFARRPRRGMGDRSHGSGDHGAPLRSTKSVYLFAFAVSPPAGGERLDLRGHRRGHHREQVRPTRAGQARLQPDELRTRRGPHDERPRLGVRRPVGERSVVRAPSRVCRPVRGTAGRALRCHLGVPRLLHRLDLWPGGLVGRSLHDPVARASERSAPHLRVLHDFRSPHDAVDACRTDRLRRPRRLRRVRRPVRLVPTQRLTRRAGGGRIVRPRDRPVPPGSRIHVAQKQGESSCGNN